MMNEAEIMNRVGDAYLPLNRPNMSDPSLQSVISAITTLVPDLDSSVIAELIATGTSWRERLVGLVLAAHSGIASFVTPMVDSLRDPRGLAIVPTLAALVVAVSEQPKCMPDDMASLDRLAFSGELGWAIDKFLFHIGHASRQPDGNSPNEGKDFEANVDLFRHIQNTTKPCTRSVNPRFFQTRRSPDA